MMADCSAKGERVARCGSATRLDAEGKRKLEKLARRDPVKGGSCKSRGKLGGELYIWYACGQDLPGEVSFLTAQVPGRVVWAEDAWPGWQARYRRASHWPDAP